MNGSTNTHLFAPGKLIWMGEYGALDGSLLLDKPEELAPTRDGSGDLWMVTDNDDPSRPSELLRVALR